MQGHEGHGDGNVIALDEGPNQPVVATAFTARLVLPNGLFIKGQACALSGHDRLARQ